MIKTLDNAVFFEEVVRTLSLGEPVELRVKGGSMRPYLRDGLDRVVLYPATDADLKRGQIVLFRYHNQYLLHRIVRRDKEHLLIQGDGVCARQEQVAVTDVFGVVRDVFRPNDKRVSAQSCCTSCYWRLWLLLRPFRRYLLFLLK